MSFRINKESLVWKQHKDLLRPGLGVGNTIVRTLNFTPDTMHKLNFLRDKYQISRSAIVRILVDAVIEENYRELKLPIDNGGTFE